MKGDNMIWYIIIGIAAFVTGNAILFRVIKNRKSVSTAVYVTKVVFSVMTVCFGAATIVVEKWHVGCFILVGITIMYDNYKRRYDYTPSFTTSYISYLKGYVTGLMFILYGVFRLLIAILDIEPL